MGRTVAALLIAMTLGACAAGDSEPLDDSGFENVGDDTAADSVGDIDWQVWDAPQLLELDAPIGEQVSYGECDVGDVVVDGNDIEIDVTCTMPWAEVAWYVLPKDVMSRCPEPSR